MSGEQAPCPKCNGTNFDHYPNEDTRYCLDCRTNSFVIEGMAIPCDAPLTNDGGFIIPANIAKEFFKDAQ